MKRIVSLLAICFLLSSAWGQSISKITIAGDGNLSAISIGLDENVVINIGKDGNINSWGFDRYQARGEENYQGKLDPYVGRVDYYGQEADSALRGKIKYIGRTLLSYFSSYENAALKGKLKMIGSNMIDYFLPYENESYKGNIRSFGPLSFTWSASYDNESYRGKLLSVGNTTLSYYSSFDDKAFRGKIKSIGSFNYSYYSSFEKYSGSMKSGSMIAIVNLIKFYARNY